VPVSKDPKVLERYLGGEPVDEIARDLGCSPIAVTRVVRRYLLRFGELTAGLGAPSNPVLGLDPVLGSRLSGAVIRFLETFDAARGTTDAAAIDQLCQSSDQLMRAIARMRLAIERSAQQGGR
jgi:hypothetical protein